MDVLTMVACFASYLPNQEVCACARAGACVCVCVCDPHQVAQPCITLGSANGGPRLTFWVQHVTYSKFTFATHTDAKAFDGGHHQSSLRQCKHNQLQQQYTVNNRIGMLDGGCHCAFQQSSTLSNTCTQTLRHASNA
eukprot:1152919-Pelagomonas_calceolata.AAC.4